MAGTRIYPFIEQETPIAQPILQPITFSANPILAGILSFQFFSQDSLISETADSGWNTIIPIIVTRLSRIRDRRFWLEYHHSSSSHKTLSYPRPPILAGIPPFQLSYKTLPAWFLLSNSQSENADSGCNILSAFQFPSQDSTYLDPIIQHSQQQLGKSDSVLVQIRQSSTTVFQEKQILHVDCWFKLENFDHMLVKIWQSSTDIFPATNLACRHITQQTYQTISTDKSVEERCHIFLLNLKFRLQTLKEFWDCAAMIDQNDDQATPIFFFFLWNPPAVFNLIFLQPMNLEQRHTSILVTMSINDM
jgi:hypothetical protein